MSKKITIQKIFTRSLGIIFLALGGIPLLMDIQFYTNIQTMLDNGLIMNIAYIAIGLALILSGSKKTTKE